MNVNIKLKMIEDKSVQKIEIASSKLAKEKKKINTCSHPWLWVKRNNYKPALLMGAFMSNRSSDYFNFGVDRDFPFTILKFWPFPSLSRRIILILDYSYNFFSFGFDTFYCKLLSLLIITRFDNIPLQIHNQPPKCVTYIKYSLFKFYVCSQMSKLCICAIFFWCTNF